MTNWDRTKWENNMREAYCAHGPSALIAEAWKLFTELGRLEKEIQELKAKNEELRTVALANAAAFSNAHLTSNNVFTNDWDTPDLGDVHNELKRRL